MNYYNSISATTAGTALNLKTQKKQRPSAVVSCAITKAECKTKVPLNTLKGYFLNTHSSNNITFGKRMEEHTSFGVTFNHDEEGIATSANAKIFTYPDVKKVEIEVAKDKDAQYLNDYKADSDDLKSFEMENKGKGIFEATELDIKPNDRYRFKLTFNNGETRNISDLYSYNQKSLTAWPVAYDQKAYDLSEEGKKLSKYSKDWNEGIIPGKVNNLKSLTDPNFIHSKDLRLMQVHIGTFTEDGNFDAAIKKLDEVKKLGFNGVEILPHGFFHDKNWGYDPSFVFASQYGGTDKFKEFCDESHKRGLNVIVDVVNNHYSMDHPEIMTEAGPYENPDPNMKLEFGPRINYTHEGKESVRDWRVNESLYWLNNKADGIRFDLSDFTGSGEFNTQLNAEIQEHFPGTVTFAESPSREATVPLPQEMLLTDLPEGSDERIERHEEIIKKAQNDEFGPNRQGYTHAWQFDWSHAIERSMLNPFDRKIGNLKDQVFDAQKQMKIMFSHDEIGKQEADGNDMIPKILLSKIFGAEIGELGWGAPRDKTERYWQASRAVRELTRIYSTDGEEWPSHEKQIAPEKSKSGDINDPNNKFYGIADYENGGLGLGNLGLTKGITREEFEEKFDQAASLNKAGIAFLFTQPGPKMVFQSFEKPDRRFAFFRKNSEHFYNTFNRSEHLEKGVDWETVRKGHRIDSDEIIDQAKVDKMNEKYNDDALNYQGNMKNLVTKLNELIDQNPALSTGEIKDVVGNHQNAISVLSKKGDNEIYSITHFDDARDFTDYDIYFPEGNWKEVLNTDSEEFGGSGEYKNDTIKGGDVIPIKLPKASTIVFKKI